MKHRFLAFIGALPLVLAGCCCVPTPVCMQRPGLGYGVPGPVFAPVGAMYRPYAPVMPVTCQPATYQGANQYPPRPHHAMIRQSWPITQTYAVPQYTSGFQRASCSDCRSQCDCNCGHELPLIGSRQNDCSAPGVGTCATEPGCHAPFDTFMDSGVFMSPGALNDGADPDVERTQRSPVPPSPPEPNSLLVEPPPEVRITVPSANVRPVNYVSLNSSMLPEDYNRSHTKSAVYETCESTTIPAETVVRKRFE
ncbi:MAG: hypothetical protein GY903_23350 [Fuerstiella sp.]|nr:hypothetical protein [Fuerstiella sp.]MCP4857431.1 hypothetical protein [Fuerstiella sp.]